MSFFLNIEHAKIVITRFRDKMGFVNGSVIFHEYHILKEKNVCDIEC